MVKIILIMIALGVLFILDGFLFSKKFVSVDRTFEGYRVIKYKLDNKTYKLLVADTPEKWTRGLMHVRTLHALDGMIFLFPESDHRTFWNENTYLDLELVWVNKGREVGRDFLPSIEKSGKKVVASPAAVDTVIELVR